MSCSWKTAALDTITRSHNSLIGRDICVQCRKRGDTTLRCASCKGFVCGDECFLDHCDWCGLDGACFEYLYSKHLNRFLAAVEVATVGEPIDVAFPKIRARHGLRPLDDKCTGFDEGRWNNNTGCLAVMCLFFSMALERFPEAAAELDIMTILCYISDVAMVHGAILKSVYCHFPEFGDSPELLAFAEAPFERCVKIDIDSGVSNVAYLVKFIDDTSQLETQEAVTEETRAAESERHFNHNLILRICGRKSCVIQAYATYYTYKEWCAFDQPLIPDSHAFHRAKKFKTHNRVDRHPKFRGVLDAATTMRLAACVGRTTAKQTAADWRALTGIHCKKVAPIRISFARLNLLASH